MTGTVKWFRLAAEQGDAPAQHNLGVSYLNGEGVLQDDREAVKWFRLAAEQGDAQAQHNLGVMYAQGSGVLQDYVSAHMWANIAGANGNEKGTELREFVAEQMTPSQIAEAQKRARECIEKFYRSC